MSAWGDEGPGPRQWLGLLGFGVVFVLYRPGADPTVLNSIVLPLLGVVSGWLFTRSVLAVALGIGALSAAHTDLDGARLAVSIVYPALAAASTLVVAVILVGRFRDAMARRRAERTDGDDDSGERRPDP